MQFYFIEKKAKNVSCDFYDEVLKITACKKIWRGIDRCRHGSLCSIIYTAIRITRDNRRWILIGDDRNLSSRRRGLMRFKNSFFPYLKK